MKYLKQVQPLPSFLLGIITLIIYVMLFFYTNNLYNKALILLSLPILWLGITIISGILVNIFKCDNILKFLNKYFLGSDIAFYIGCVIFGILSIYISILDTKYALISPYMIIAIIILIAIHPIGIIIFHLAKILRVFNVIRLRKIIFHIYKLITIIGLFYICAFGIYILFIKSHILPFFLHLTFGIIGLALIVYIFFFGLNLIISSTHNMHVTDPSKERIKCLFLRSFEVDSTTENKMLSSISKIIGDNNIIRVSDPELMFQPNNNCQTYALPTKDWKHCLQQCIINSQIVFILLKTSSTKVIRKQSNLVFFSNRLTNGLIWELFEHHSSINKYIICLDIQEIPIIMKELIDKNEDIIYQAIANYKSTKQKSYLFITFNYPEYKYFNELSEAIKSVM